MYTYKRSIKVRSRHNFCCEKAISITYSECVCSLCYTACNSHAPYYTVQLLHMFFPHYSTQHDFREYVTEHEMCVLISSTNFIRNISHSKKKSVRYQCAYVLMYSTRYSRQLLLKLQFHRHNFENSPNIKFHEHPSYGSRVLPCERTERQTLRS
jgi:hypothetical protein